MPIKKRVLIVEDDIGLRYLLIEIFRQLDRRLSVDFFKSGQQLLQFLTTNVDARQSSLILLKDPIGKTSAVRILELLNTREELKTLPKIVWGDMPPVSVQQVKTAGAADYLRMPLQPSEVKKTLKEILSFISLTGESHA